MTEALPTNEQFQALGANLHDLMTAAMKEAEAPWLPHEDHPDHNIAVGRAMWLFQNGKHDEAERFYNEWSAVNGFPGVRIISRQPLQVDIGLAIGGMVADFCGDQVRILTVGEWVRPGFQRIPPADHWHASAWGRIAPAFVVL